MSHRKTLIEKDLYKQARSEKQNLKDHVLCTRLQAIISTENQPVQIVAAVIGISRMTLCRWIKRFRMSGINGLCDKPKGHKASKLGEKEREFISKWLNEGKNSKGKPIHWTLPKLVIEIKNEFGIQVGKTSLWRTLKKMKFVMKVPRPVHAKADPIKQDEFKKKQRKK
jgi:transposase